MDRGFGRLILVSMSSALLLYGALPAKASATRFYCAVSSGIPTTMAVTSKGKTVPIIRWKSGAFSDAGWDPGRRCNEVSSRFEEYRQQGRLRFLTTGRLNGLPVICTTDKEGGACDGLLYTLKPGQNASVTLRSLLDIRTKARGPLSETEPRIYLDINTLLNPDLSAGIDPDQPSSVRQRSSVPTTNTGTSGGLW